MEPKELFRRVLQHVEPCIRQVSSDQLQNATPCSDWDLRALLRHIVYELLWVPELLEGKTVSDIGDRFEGDVLGSDIQGAWDRASHAALAAVENADLSATTHLSYADVSAASYITEIAGDVLLHGWDVDQSIMCNMLMPDELAQTVYEAIFPRKDEFASSGLFGTPLDVAEDATVQTKLLALVGRKST